MKRYSKTCCGKEVIYLVKDIIIEVEINYQTTIDDWLFEKKNNWSTSIKCSSKQMIFFFLNKKRNFDDWLNQPDETDEISFDQTSNLFDATRIIFE